MYWQILLVVSTALCSNVAALVARDSTIESFNHDSTLAKIEHELEPVDLLARESTFDTGAARAQNSDSSRKWCYLYREVFSDSKGQKREKLALPGKGLEDCNKQCGPMVPGIARSCGYMGFSEYSWQADTSLGKNIEKAMAPCNCNDKDATLIAQGIMKVFAVVGEVTCNVWVGALTGFVDFFLNTALDSVDGVVSAVNAMGGLKDEHGQIIQGALAIKSSVADKAAGRSVFGKWMASKVCAGGALTQQQTDDMWNTITNINDMVVGAVTLPLGGAGALNAFRYGSTIPKLTAELQGNIDKIGKLDPPKSRVDNPIGNRDKGTAVKTKEEPTKTTAQTTEKTTSHPTTSACAKNKRGEENGHCEVKRTITKVLNSVPMVQTITKTCNAAKHTQACYHYYSAIQNGADDKFTCTNSHSEPRDGKIKNAITAAWADQHDESWRAYRRVSGANKKLQSCDRDEWPPAYFVPGDIKLQGEAKWQQHMRWLPASENRGAGQAWNAFCKIQDGGEGNGQFRAKAKGKGKRSETDDEDLLDVPSDDSGDEDYDPDNNGKPRKKPKPNPKPPVEEGDKLPDELNDKLVDYKKHFKERIEGKDKVFTEYYTDVPYTRAVFSLKFEFPNGKPSAENDWFLKENPCWPKDIVPDDPGFVLPLNDKWYKTAAKGIEAFKTVEQYRIAPSADRAAAAVKAQNKRLGIQEEADPTKKNARRYYEDVPWIVDRLNLSFVGERDIEEPVPVNTPVTLPDHTQAVPTSFTTIKRELARAAHSLPLLPAITAS